ncbi:MAG: ADP-glyceromanno-heptose 6-epimerase [Chitinophagaceae bacterium]|nr:ADP-glyceromanno-heptose 6-epimerase [Chitinophagaceae bacterium]
MDRNSVIMVTGAAGFIGSCMTGFLNEKGFNRLIIVDDFSEADKEANYRDKTFKWKVERNELFQWLESATITIDFVFHLGARTDTTEFDYSIHEELNVEYSKKIWSYCAKHSIPLVYASSAATYGNGELGYSDDHSLVDRLQPLNPYGVSKNEFDKWALQQPTAPPYWSGLKFFNVYGPNEYHKARMASVIFHSFIQILDKGKVRLFRSHRPDFKDGEQLRDFIYVEDVLAVCYWFMQVWSGGSPAANVASGLYNLGTGKARSFNDLVTAIYTALGKEVNIEYFDTPMDIRDKYQYFTEADMAKLREAGYDKEFYSLEKGVEDYVIKYLRGRNYY